MRARLSSLVVLFLAFQNLWSAVPSLDESFEGTAPSLNLLRKGAELNLHGFGQVSYSPRITGLKPSAGKGDFIFGEERLQLSLSGTSGSNGFLKKGDFFHDGLTGKSDLEIREAYLDLGGEIVEARVGRQIITWGTGDLLFINDLFPKDWTALFAGRPLEYLKIGSDGMKINLHLKTLEAEAVVVPFFESDRMPSSDRFFFFDPFTQVTNRITNKPNSDLEKTELALKISHAFSSWDTALYTSRGFFRAPVMVPDNFTSPTQITFEYPRRNVYGASTRGSAVGGVINFEAGYSDSRQDPSGSNPLIANSQALYLAGYQRQLGEDLTAGLQYYGEYTMQYDRYLANLPAGFPKSDELRQVIATRLTQFMKYQTWKLSLFGYYSPTDEDFYLIHEVWHSLADGLWVSLGANVFGGAKETTFFGQFDKNDNLYANMRYEF